MGLCGLAGLTAWIAIARQYGLDGPYSALTALFACAAPMIIWSLLHDKVHRRASTGIDWKNPKPLKATLDTSIVKLVGLWATWGIIAVIYCIGRWYWAGNYQFAMNLMAACAPWLAAISIPYVLFTDRFMVDPRDGAWHFGCLLAGRRSEADMTQVQHHLRAWAVKGFFLAFMLSIVPGGFGDLVRADFSAIAHDPAALAHWLIVAMFVIDVQFATVGYLLTMKPLDAHIRTANPYLAGWVAALMCYPPFLLMDGGPLTYAINTADWAYWMNGQIPLMWVWGAILVVLTALYAWATVAFGLRFSNLTHRGILTNGPYAFSKHPAYLAKNAYWWLSTLPFLVTSNSLTDAVRNTVMLCMVSGVYYWRAKTEEKHLLSDPAYKTYAEWMDRNAPVPRLINAIKRRIGWWPAQPTPDVQPAE
ncbi:MAG: isoprenylcysteine carboxylmethyltransferase family protein [Parasphingorhabdus sp.]|nr:isoprenylcysteine carboxylmethyltransferase family protein [Parasphingorhabdus sp.]